MEAKAGYTYRVFFGDEEVEHFNVTKVLGRRIHFGWTAWSALYEQTTRTRWRKLISAVQDAGGTVTEELTTKTTETNEEERI